MEDRKDKQIVQQVFESSLSGIQDDPRMAQRVLNKAHEASGTGGLKKKLSVGLIFALVVAMSSLVALACSHSYVIQYLFGRNMDSEEAQRMEGQVQSIDFVQSSETTVCTVKDAYFDGRTLAVGIGFQTDRPVYIVGDEVKVNGERVDYIEHGSSIEEMWVGNQVFSQEYPEMMEQIHGVQYIFSRPLSKGEKAEVTMRITLLVPKTGVEGIDLYQNDHRTMWTQIDSAHEKGLTPVSVDEPYEVLISSGWHKALDRTKAYQGPLCDVDALVQYANMEVMDTVEVTFVLNATES